MNQDEVLITDDIDSYFRNLVFLKSNPYIKYSNTFYTAEPSISIYYSDKGKIESKPKERDPCIIKEKGKFKRQWLKIFTKSFKLIDFKNSPECSWRIIQIVMEHFFAKDRDLKDIKNDLIQAYKGYNILPILKKQGKEHLVEKIEGGQMSLENTIQSNTYFLSEIDFFVLSKKHNIPLVLFSGKPLRELTKDITRGERKEMKYKMITFANDSQSSFYFIRIKDEPDNLPTYSLLFKGTFLISENVMPPPLGELVSKRKFDYDLKTYIENYDLRE